MSSSDGGLVPLSIFEHLDSCQPASAASARAVSPESFRISRRRRPKETRASLTAEEEGGVDTVPQTVLSHQPVLGVGNDRLPDGLKRRGEERNQVRVLGVLVLQRLALTIEVVDQRYLVVEDPVVVAG